MSEPSSLTERQLRFCHEFAAEPIRVQAYMKAFPHVAYTTANTESRRLLQNPLVQAEIAVARHEHQRACRVDATRTLLGLAAVAFADPADVFDEADDGSPTPRPLSRVPARVRKTLQSVKVKRRRLRSDKDATAWEVEEVEYKFADKMSAFDKLCKHLGITGDGAALEEFLNALRGTGAAAAPAAAEVGAPPADADAADRPLTVADVK